MLGSSIAPTAWLIGDAIMTEDPVAGEGARLRELPGFCCIGSELPGLCWIGSEAVGIGIPSKRWKGWICC